ncbi:ABC transporter permease [Rhizobium hidalgonense]|uniref:ABC transporter permease n=2 Tax=Rhizobium hidalgonense TaxID=1538159 RepID=A0A2A6KF11_9HYPH|nr:ABC transporter permease [Rhizobium hidalgonense]EJC77959.1 ABC-type dipeptide/oligopeptide/nickel transport system, permease component [Rhizobium leguminosarum bv. trifolii WSM2012]MDR9772757.1 ABC transporter permease [Rhizobium hidalgonense]MDR9806868.1 ABC transporter permease [Rhizobium hidalgonense]MDR9812879.1 ABC transporter permease [Rhizobium hidalgonense]MDR9820217.1 ABC transporter permease [Rhizobium hidalgonense]
MLAFDSSDTPPTTEPAIKKPSHGSESYLALVWRRLRRSWTGMAGLILVGLLLIMAIFADFFAPMDPKATDVGFAPPQVMSFHDKDGNFVFQPRVYALSDSEELDPVTFQPIVGMDYDNPRLLGFFVKGAEYKLLGLIPADRHFFGSTDGQPVHFLGTDKFGRDVLSRAIIGSRISLTIALTVVFIVTLIGTTVGMVSGYFGGTFDVWLQRFVELVLAFPQLPLYLALTSLIPVTAPTNVFLAFVIIVMSALGWAQMSREVRGKTLALARIDYVRAAMAVGATDRRIILQHIFPNVMSHVIVAVTLAIPSVVLLESFLGFLGFAVKPPLISWGLMLQDTATYSVIGSYPWILSPVGFVLVTVFAFNALGDGLRDAVDPY